jgi:UDP-3-O-[3-hydroxymyristoyl] glucosamine N-acyltransferase
MTKNLLISEIARLVGGIVSGSGEKIITGLNKIEDAGEGELTFLGGAAYQKYFPATKATAILVKRDFEKSRSDLIYIEVDDPGKAFLVILTHYFTPEITLQGIDPSAYIHPTAFIGPNVSIGKNVVIEEGCVIGKGTKIFHNTVILRNTVIGDDCLIFQNVSLREDSVLGNRVILHPGVVIGSDGFGFTPDQNGVYQKIPQIGIVIIEDDVEIGANTTIDRAALGHTIIKRGTKIDNLVQIAHNVSVGEDTVMSAQVGIAGSSKIGRHCVLAGQVGITGHIEIGDNVIIGAQSGVPKSLPEAGTYFGYPAKPLNVALRTEGHIRNLEKYASRIKKLEDKIVQLEKLLEKPQA